MYHDLSDDYKSRDYVIAIVLQDGEYYGNIYYEYNYNKYGLPFSVMRDILTFIENLNCEEIDDYNSEGILHNDIRLKADVNGKDIHFILRNDNGDLLKKCIPYDELENYIVGYNMVKCEGHGKKKEIRRCGSCESFTPIEGSYKGDCLIHEKKVQRNRIICAHDYVEKK